MTALQQRQCTRYEVMSLAISIPLHAKADVLGPMLVKFANGRMIRADFFDGVVGGQIEASDADRRKLMLWFEKLPEPSKLTLNQIAGTAQRMTLNKGQPILSGNVRGGRIDLVLNFNLHAQDNLSTLAYMLASVIGAGMGRNIRKCPHCDQWFFAMPKSGPIQTYCSTSHSNAARQKRHRASKEKL